MTVAVCPGDAALTSMVSLDVSNNHLDISNNLVSDFSPISTLPNLSWVHASGNDLNCADQAANLDAICPTVKANQGDNGEFHNDCDGSIEGQTQCPIR